MNFNPALERYLLNCFSVEFSVQSVTVAQLLWTEETDMRELRKNLGNDWFVLRRGDKIYGMPTVAKPAVEFGNATTVLSLSDYDGLDFMRARLDAALPNLSRLTNLSVSVHSAFSLKRMNSSPASPPITNSLKS